jgi:hypothetical protein
MRLRHRNDNRGSNISGEVRLRFDPTRIPEHRLRELLRVAPYRQEDLLPLDVASGQQLLDLPNGMEPPQELY